MVVRYRIPNWYKFLVLILYTLSGSVLFGSPFPRTPTVFVLYAVYAAIGLWIILMWNKTLALDTEKKALEIGKRRISIDEVEDIRLGFFGLSVVVQTKRGKEVFPYPLEDAEDFIEVFENLKYSKEVRL